MGAARHPTQDGALPLGRDEEAGLASEPNLGAGPGDREPTLPPSPQEPLLPPTLGPALR